MTEESKGEEGKVQSFIAMLQTQPTDSDCQQCLDQLGAYVDVQLDGGGYQTQFPVVARHLDSCVTCAEAYALVYEVALADRNGRLPQPAYIPEPDLSFLEQPPSLWEALQAALQQTRAQISLQLDTVLTTLLAPQPSLALTRAGEDARFGEQILSLKPEYVPETSLPFSLAAYADKDNPDQCLVEITVEPPGLSWPDLGDSEVKISYGGVERMETTDDWGTAVFADIPRSELENLRFDITLAQLE